MAGTPDRTKPGSAVTPDERRVASACSAVVHESRVLVVTIMGLGALLALGGWGAARRQGEAVPLQVTHAAQQ